MIAHYCRLILMSFVACAFSATGFAADLPSVKTKSGSVVYYKAPVTRGEATALRDYLVEAEFFDETPKEVLLSKEGKTYEFNFVVKKGIETDPEFIAKAKIFSKGMSEEVFDNASVDIHLLDDKLNLLKVVVAF
jgi:hypothetical protein